MHRIADETQSETIVGLHASHIVRMLLMCCSDVASCCSMVSHVVVTYNTLRCVVWRLASGLCLVLGKFVRGEGRALIQRQTAEATSVALRGGQDDDARTSCLLAGGRNVLEMGEGGVWLGSPSSWGPLVVPAEGGPKTFKPESSWRRRHRSKNLAVSLKHWEWREWGGGGSGGGGTPLLLRCRAVLTHHRAGDPPPHSSLGQRPHMLCRDCPLYYFRKEITCHPRSNAPSPTKQSAGGCEIRGILGVARGMDPLPKPVALGGGGGAQDAAAHISLLLGGPVDC